MRVEPTIPNTEVERKWLVPGLPEGYTPRKEKEIQSFYLVADDEVEMRVSKRTTITHDSMGKPVAAQPTYRRTIKVGNGLVRQEFEKIISVDEFMRLCRADKYGRHTKHWYKFPMNDGLVLEVNCVDGKWWYAEVEFPNKEAADNWQPIPYLLNGVEVTGNPDYQMKNYYRKNYMEED